MMRDLFTIFKFAVFLCLLFLALYHGGSVSFHISGNSVEIHIVVIAFVLGAIFYLYGKLTACFRNIFFGKSKYEKGIESLEKAFSSMLLKDTSLMKKFIEKSRKHLGDIPIVSWLNGQLCRINGEEHMAKSIFYGLSEHENGTIFGAYGLCQLAAKNKSDNETLSAIDAILKVSSGSHDLALQAVAISVKNKNFSSAKQYLPFIKKHEKKNLIKAIIYAEEAALTKNMELAKKSFKLAPGLSNNAINYAELLIKNQKDYRGARKILRKSFETFQDQEVFDKYVICKEDASELDQVKLAEKLTRVVPQSWIVHFGLAQLAIRAGAYQLAFRSLLRAYDIEQYDFIADKLIDVAKNLANPKPPSAIEILSEPLKSKRVFFTWRCDNCGIEESRWVPVCKCCCKIAEYRYYAESPENHERLEFVSNYDQFL
jgi:uncharacterized membrane-anchored protein